MAKKKEDGNGVTKSESRNLIVRSIEKAKDPFLQIVKDNGADLTFTTEAMYATRLCMKSKELMACEPDSIYHAVIDAATSGISLNPVLQHATLIGYNIKVGKDQWVKRAYFTPMYRGLVWLAIDSQIVESVEADVVYERDRTDGIWIFKRGINPQLEHAAYLGKDRFDSDFLGVWTMARLGNGKPPIIDFMPAEDIYKARDASQAYRDKKTGELYEDAPWLKWFTEQAKKTGVKRAQKLWPHTQQRSGRFAAAIAMDNRAERAGAVIEGEAEELIMLSHDQTNVLNDLIGLAKLRPETFMQSFGIDRLEDLPVDKFEEAKERLEARAAAVATARGKTGKQAAKSKPQDREPGSDDEPEMSAEDIAQFEADMAAQEARDN